MFVFNEGVPRAGKSYDAVKSHILPALKKKRHTWARLNGLNFQAIADYLKVPLSQIETYLHIVESKDVVKTFVATKDETGKWVLAPELQNALVVIDEVHEFYVKERKPLAPEVEAFFALLGQNGGDAVIMTQWIQRLHDAVKARIEKKNSFQKLSAVGMKGKYLVTYYQTVAAGKYEKIGSSTKSYEAAIYPLYHGYAPGADNTEVYSEGGTNVWKGMALRASIFVVLGLVGIFGLIHFFKSGGEGFVKGEKAALLETAQPVQGGVTYTQDDGPLPQSRAPVAQSAGTAQQVKEKIDPYKDLTDEQRYVAQLSDKGRIRLAARAEIGGRVLAHVSWMTTEGVAIETLDLPALRELGYEVDSMGYGIKLTAGKHVFVATPWPLVVAVRESDARLYNTSGNSGGAAGLASAASELGGATAQQGAVVQSVVSTADVFPRSAGYKPSGSGK